MVYNRKKFKKYRKEVVTGLVIAVIVTLGWGWFDHRYQDHAAKIAIFFGIPFLIASAFIGWKVAKYTYRISPEKDPGAILDFGALVIMGLFVIVVNIILALKHLF